MEKGKCSGKDAVGFFRQDREGPGRHEGHQRSEDSAKESMYSVNGKDQRVLSASEIVKF